MQNIKLKTKDNQTPSSENIDNNRDIVIRSTIKKPLTEKPSINCAIKMDHNSVDGHVNSLRLASYIPRGVFGCLAMK